MHVNSGKAKVRNLNDETEVVDDATAAQLFKDRPPRFKRLQEAVERLRPKDKRDCLIKDTEAVVSIPDRLFNGPALFHDEPDTVQLQQLRERSLNRR